MKRGRLHWATALSMLAVLGCSDALVPTGPVASATSAAASGRLLTLEDAAAFGRSESVPLLSAAVAGLEADGEKGGSWTRCVGVLTGVFERVVVPAGAMCGLTNSIVEKDVVALEHSVLGMSFTSVGGDLKGKKADVIQVQEVTIGGNVDVRNGGSHPLFIEVVLCGVTVTRGHMHVQNMTGGIQIGLASQPQFCSTPSRIGGHLELKENLITAARMMSVRGNMVGGDGKIFKNEGPGTKVVQSNTFAKQLDCKGNAAPFVGGPNVARRTEGQCF